MNDDERAELAILLNQHKGYFLGYNVEVRQVLSTRHPSTWHVKDHNAEWHPGRDYCISEQEHDTFWGAYDEGKKYLEARGQSIHR